MKIIGIIPARYGSSRFPGKPLAVIQGKTMIQRVTEQALAARSLAAVVVATDDVRIHDHIAQLGYRVVMTATHHPSGTDRCLEALVNSGIQADAVINIQGDEPFVAPSQIDALADLISRPQVDIATLVKRIHDTDTLLDPNRVKVVTDLAGKALYFSRQAIPFQKNESPENWIEHHTYYKHIGLYAYKTSVLKEIAGLKPSALELAESLEQLRWLENGKAIYTAATEIETPAIDTPEDLEKLLKGLSS